MKKTILFLAVVLAAGSCIKDDRMDHAPADSLGFSAVNTADVASRCVPVTVCSETFPVGIAKSGRSQSALQATVQADASRIGELSYETGGLPLKALPASLYSLSETAFSFAAEDLLQTFDVQWDAAKVYALLEEDPACYVIPLTLSGEGVKPKRDLQALCLQTSSLSLACISDEDRSKDVAVYNPPVAIGVEVFEIRLLIDGLANPRRDMSVTVAVDNDAIDAFQKTTGNYYVVPPEGSVALYADQLNLARGEQQVPVRLIIDNDRLGAKHPGYVVPIRITSTSLPIARGREILYVTLPPAL